MAETKEIFMQMFEKWGVTTTQSLIDETSEDDYVLSFVKTTSKTRRSVYYHEDYVCGCDYPQQKEEIQSRFNKLMSSGEYTFENIKTLFKKEYNKKNTSTKNQNRKKSVTKEDLRNRVSFLESKTNELLLRCEKLEAENIDLSTQVIDFGKIMYDYNEGIINDLLSVIPYEETYIFSTKTNTFRTNQGKKGFPISRLEGLDIICLSKKYGYSAKQISERLDFENEVNEETIKSFLEKYYSGKMYYAFRYICKNPYYVVDDPDFYCIPWLGINNVEDDE